MNIFFCLGRWCIVIIVLFGLIIDVSFIFIINIMLFNVRMYNIKKIINRFARCILSRMMSKRL